MENLGEKKSKLKNKKKDVITADLSEVIDKSKKDDVEVENKSTYNSNSMPGLNPSIEQKIEINENNSSTINKIIFNIQLLLSLTNKVDEKLVNVFSFLLSQDHLKLIVEERDCREVCCNLLCGMKIKKNKSGKLFYNPQFKSFTKDDVMDLFCDVRCFQKFKDLSYIASKFDYFRLLNIETIFLFTIISEYYPKNQYLDKISHLAQGLLNSAQSKFGLEEKLKEYKGKYDKYFVDDEIVEKVENLDINEGEVAINKMFNS